MGRLVRKPQLVELDLDITERKNSSSRSGAAEMKVVKLQTLDGYLERMVKYVPAEIIAFSMLVNAILDQAMKSGGENAAMAGIPVPIVAIGALVVACMLTPVFCWYVREDGDAWIVNAIVSTVALPFWAYLMGAVAFANHHDGSLAAILVMSFTVVSGLVSPQPETLEVHEQVQEQDEDDEEVVAPIASETPRLFNALAS
jgi:hypothetical protein